MGYGVYITRAERLLDARKIPITVDEWKAVVANDEELEFADHGKIQAVWLDELGDERGRLRLFNGYIITKNPSKELIEKMKVLARQLSAKIVGDHGETYS